MNTDEMALMIPIIAICGAFAVAIVSLIVKSAASVARSKHVEQSRREIAAYIAEGSMTPEEGERLIKAGPQKTRGCRSC